MRDLLVNLLASVLAGSAVWISQRLLRYRRLARKRAFFGLGKDARCVLSVARHAASPHEMSVHRRDVAALVELATVAKDCGARADLTADDGSGVEGVGRVTEFAVGGPYGNPRTAVHLRSLLPGAHVARPGGGAHTGLPLRVGGAEFRPEPDGTRYVLLARAWGPYGGRPVFVLGGQTARSNHAAARFLATRYRDLHRRYGAKKPFCLVLRVVEPDAYGSDFTEIAVDATADAFQPAVPPAARTEVAAAPAKPVALAKPVAPAEPAEPAEPVERDPA